MFNLSQISSNYENDNQSIEKPSTKNDDSKKPKNRTLKRRLVKNDLNQEASSPLTNDIYNSLDESNLAGKPPPSIKTSTGLSSVDVSIFIT